MVKVTGKREHLDRLRRISGPEMVREVGAALYAAGSLIEIDAEISITQGSVSGRFHVPSRPGEPPNADTRHLDTNIETAQVEPLKVTITSNARYSAALEYGTSRMQARPFMRPALQKNRERAERMVASAVDRVVHGRMHRGNAT